MSKLKIADLVEVPEVKTVIQLADCQKPELRSHITSSFVVTSEIERVFRALLSDLSSREGRGYFIEGNFGSGKSHLLSIINLLFSRQADWQPVAEQLEDEKISQQINELKEQNFLTLTISLVEHSSREYLEQIVLDKLRERLAEEGREFFWTGGEEQEFVSHMEEMINEKYGDQLEQYLKSKGLSREEIFNREDLSELEALLDHLSLPYRFKYDRSRAFELLNRYLEESKFQGLVLLIDELSEFLRSKSSGRRFNEDIRFLQFIGEHATHEPYWILATLQEEIEKTGETTPEAFNKIKDRYPVRFYLGEHHIKELISGRLIRKKPGSAEKISEIYDKYCELFPRTRLSRTAFLELYPVHPPAVDLLDNLKPLFSQHRGVIDFIHYQLKGDESRDIPGMLEESSDSLLTAERIFDHFLARIRESLATNPYYEKVYKFYQQEIDSLLAEEDKETGLGLIKLLILAAISPLEKKLTVDELAGYLLKPVTELDPEANYQYIQDQLDQLLRQGAYLNREKTEEGETLYFIDLEADVNLILERRTEYLVSNFFPQDSRLVSRVGQLVEDSAMPLASLLENTRSRRRVSWQKTERSGFLYFLKLEELSLENISNISEHLNREEDDFALFVGWPLAEEKQRKYLQEVLLPELARQEIDNILFWLPQEVGNKEFLQQVLALLMLQEEYQQDRSSQAREIQSRIEERLENNRSEVVKLFRQAFYNGQVITAQGEVMLTPAEEGYLPFERLLARIVSRLLEKLYPYHSSIAPYQPVLTSHQISLVVDSFFAPGEIEAGELTNQLREAVESYLKPMGLIEERGQKIKLQVDPGQNRLVQSFFNQLEESRTPAREIYFKLRKGSYGLIDKQYKLLVYALLFSGFITAYGEKQKLPLDNFTGKNFWRIKYLGQGEIISPEFQRVLADCELLPPRLRKEAFSLTLQQKIWDYLVEYKRNFTEEERDLRSQLTKLESRGILPEETLTRMSRQLDKAEALLEEIKVSYSSGEGLERFASHYRSFPHADSYLQSFSRLKDFLQENLPAYRRMKNYLEDERLKLSAEDNYKELRDFRSNLLESFGSSEVVFSEKYFSRLEAGFSEFLQLYTEKYRSEHQQQLAPERFEIYENLRQHSSYQVLSRLAGIEMISVKDDLIKIDRKISRILQNRCQKFSPERLQQEPVCQCGFQLGDELKLPAVKEIQGQIERGIRQYITSLQQEEIKTEIEDYLTSMEAAGKKRFTQPIRELFQLDPEIKKRDSLEDLENLLNSRMIENINRALSGEIKLIERNLDELYENLVGRRFAPEQLKNIFREWLEGPEGLETGTYIKIIPESGKTTAEEEAKLIELVEKAYPELAPAARELKEDRFILLLALLNWQQEFSPFLAEKSWLEELSRESKLTGLFEYREELDAYKSSLRELKKQIFTESGSSLQEYFQDNLDRALQESGVLSYLTEKLSSLEPEELLEIINNEEMSVKLVEKLALLLGKKISGEAVNPEEVEKFQDKLTSAEADTSRKAEFKRTFALFFGLQNKLQIFASWQPPDKLEDWLKYYTEHLARLELKSGQLAETASQTGLTAVLPVQRIEKQVLKTCRLFNKDYQDFYESLFMAPARTAPQEEPLRIENLIIERYPELLERVSQTAGYLILLDGLRFDIWQEIYSRVLAEMPLREITSGMLVSHLPSNTEAQLAALEEADFKGEILSPQNSAWQPGRDIIKFGYIDDKIHTSRDDYLELVREINFQTRNRLKPFLDKIPADSPVLIFGDHGFTINYQFEKQEKYTTPRYLHGGASAEEMLVPWSFLLKQ